MSWVLYRWVWRLEAPLYVGLSPAGVLNRCRLYVPARNLWAAFTAQLARRRMGNHSADLREYQQVGERLCQSCRFSYLYPAEPVNDEWKAWLPAFEQGQGLCWRREGGQEPIADVAMRRRLLDARPGTAIEPETDAAAEGSLRETELITPWWRGRSGVCQPVAMAGYFFCRDEKLVDDLRAIDEIHVGGDTRYGLGKLTREDIESAQRFFDNNLRLDGDDPQVSANRVLAHAEARKADSALMGALERLAQWDVGTFSPVGDNPFWVPGSRLMNAEGRWRIRQDGLWALDG